MTAPDTAGHHAPPADLEADDIAFARGILQRSKGIRFTAASLAASGGEAVMDAAFARAELARAVKRYDQVLAEDQPGLATWHEALGRMAGQAAEKAGDLIAAVRVLHGSPAADSLARGTGEAA